MIDFPTRLINQIQILLHGIVVLVEVVELREEVAEVGEDVDAFGRDDVEVQARLLNDLASELNEFGSLDQIEVFFLDLEALAHVPGEALQALVHILDRVHPGQELHLRLLRIDCDQSHILSSTVKAIHYFYNYK